MTIKELFKINGDMSVNSNIKVFGCFGVFQFEGRLSEFIENHEGLYSCNNIIKFNTVYDAQDDFITGFEFEIW